MVFFSSSGGAAERDGLKKGCVCEARYQGKARWYPGKVETVHAGGSVDVRYDDRDMENKVQA